MSGLRILGIISRMMYAQFMGLIDGIEDSSNMVLPQAGMLSLLSELQVKISLYGQIVFSIR